MRALGDRIPVLTILKIVLSSEGAVSAELARRLERSDEDLDIRKAANASVGILRAAARANVVARGRRGSLARRVSEGIDQLTPLFDALEQGSPAISHREPRGDLVGEELHGAEHVLLRDAADAHPAHDVAHARVVEQLDLLDAAGGIVEHEVGVDLALPVGVGDLGRRRVGGEGVPLLDRSHRRARRGEARHVPLVRLLLEVVRLGLRRREEHVEQHDGPVEDQVGVEVGLLDQRHVAAHDVGGRAHRRERRRQCEREAAFDGLLDRRGAADAHQQHLLGPAHGRGPRAHGREREELAVVAVPLPRPRVEDDVERLGEPGLGGGFLHLEHDVLRPLVAAADAEVGAAVADAVEQRGTLGEAQRVRERLVDDRGADAHTRRTAEQVRGHVDGVGARAVVEEVLLGHPHAVVAERLGEVDPLELLGVDLFGRDPGRHLERVVGAELHDSC